MILRILFIGVLALTWGLAFSFPVMATMGGMTNVGPLFIQGESTTAIRELVELKRSGELLVGKPRHAFVDMITLHAPGLRDGHLILRELLTREGKQTLLLTAPESVMTHVLRATLYTRGLEESIALYEHIDDVWVKRLPQTFLIDSPVENRMPKQMLRAFSVRTLGFYWLLKPSMTQSLQADTQNAISPSTLMGGKITPGLLPSILGIILFILCGILSRYIHKTAKLREL